MALASVSQRVVAPHAKGVAIGQPQKVNHKGWKPWTFAKLLPRECVPTAEVLPHRYHLLVNE
jgi:hypothetical protein